MKKLLFACASLLLVSSAMADGADFKMSGELRARHSTANNAGFAKDTWKNGTVQRTKLGFTMTKGDDLSAQVTLMARGDWGNQAAPQGGYDADAGVVVYEAWAFWKAFDNVSFKIGRGALDLADGTIVSRNDFEQDPYSFEGLVATYFHDMFNLSAFFVKGMQPAGGAIMNTDFYALSADFKIAPEYLKMFNVTVLQAVGKGLMDDPAAPTVFDGNEEALRLSVTLAGDSSGFDYRGTFAMLNGKEDYGAKQDQASNMIDAEFGYTFADMMNLRLAGLIHRDSGTKAGSSKDKTYDPFFYNKHDNAGMMDIIQWGNSTYIKLGFAVEPSEMFTAGFDYYMFKKTEKDDGVNNSYGVAATGSGSNVGSEMDLWTKKVYSNGTEVGARYGMFKPGKAFGSGLKTVNDFSLSATFRF